MDLRPPRDPRSKPETPFGSRRPWLSRALLPVTLGVVLGVFEIGLRVIYPHGVEKTMESGFPWLVRQPVVGWRNAANYRSPNFSTNEQHLRGPEISLDKPEGVLRIACLGDSRTFGIWLDRGGLRFDNDYPRLLQKRIDRADPARRVEVLNIGVIGYTTVQAIRQLVTYVPRLDPDILVVNLGVNDHVPSWDPSLQVRTPENPLLVALLSATHEWRLVQLGLAAWAGIEEHPPAWSIPWVAPGEYTANLRRIVELAEQIDTRLLFLHQGLRPLDLGEDIPAVPGEGVNPLRLLGAKDLADLHRQHGEYRERLGDVARESGVPLIDASELLGRDGRPPGYGPYDQIHTNVEGARQVAEAIHRALLQRDWL